jgi:hypothetical protein
MKDLHPADFHTPAFGLVFRLLGWPSLLINPAEVSSKPRNGEWRPLEYTSWLLSTRFGFRRRPYATHVAKVAARPLLHEMARALWPAELARTAAHRFRGARGDVYMMFAFVHFVVERHREALLWAFVVGRIGGDDDEWRDAHRRSAWAELGGAPGEEDDGGVLTVRVAKRDTLAPERVQAVLDATGDGLGGTQYQFCTSNPSLCLCLCLCLSLTPTRSEPGRLPVRLPRRQRPQLARRPQLVADALQRVQLSPRRRRQRQC